MRDPFDGLAFRPADILLPQNCDYTKWSVVACDQYTSQPEYWQEVEELVGSAPSTLRLILPESCLDGPSVETDIMEVNNTMTRYLREERFCTLPASLIYVERRLDNLRLRRGLVGMVDLEQYDYEPGAEAQVRATEGTVMARIPPRVAVRKNAPLELPHVMLLADDPEKTVLEPLSARKDQMEKVYDFDLMERGGHIAGVHLLIDGQDKDLAADRVILAAGGAGRMYPYTTNPPVATADGLAVAWRAGAQVADLEFYQFHPTAMAVGEHFLVSEAVRGEGAVLLDEHGHRYMKDIDPRAELAPRDVVARENFRVMQAQGGKPVMLDVSPMARENPDLASFLAHRFPTIDAYTRSLGFDWSKEPIPVAPAAHYYMGGIRTDLNARTSIPGLYAAGECARTGVMGSNRLASNSLLEGLVYGRRAGLAAVADGDDAVWAPEPFLNSATGAVFDHAPIALAAPAATAAADDTAADKVWNRTRIQNTMWHGVGVLRDEAGLKTAIAELGQGLAAANAQADVNADGAASSVEALENRNMLTVGYVAATAALARTESRGAHARTDHSEPVDNWAHSVAYIKD